jgi:hypothetical protein
LVSTFLLILSIFSFFNSNFHLRFKCYYT